MKYKGLKIMFCIPGPSFSSHFLNSWDALTRFLNKEKIDYGLNTGYAPLVNIAREKVLGIDFNAKNKIPFQGKIDYDYIMWIDSDITFNPNDFENLLQTKTDVISGYYTMLNNTGKHLYAAIKNKKHLTPKIIEDYKNTKECKCETVMEVDKPCLGFLLIKKEVMDQLTYPYFEIKYEDNIHKNEAHCFFEKIKEAGFIMHIHTACRVGHIKQQIF